MLHGFGVGLQDDISNPGVPFACGLTLEKLSAHTVDEDGNEAFVKDNPLSLLRKVCTVSVQFDILPMTAIKHTTAHTLSVP